MNTTGNALHQGGGHQELRVLPAALEESAATQVTCDGARQSSMQDPEEA